MSTGVMDRLCHVMTYGVNSNADVAACCPHVPGHGNHNYCGPRKNLVIGPFNSCAALCILHRLFCVINLFPLSAMWTGLRLGLLLMIKYSGILFQMNRYRVSVLFS